MDEKVMVGGVEGEKESNKGKKDMVDLLLEAEGGSFSMGQMVDFCVNLLAAGYDTTSLTMTLAVKFLTETPTALAQLRVRIKKCVYYLTQYMSLIFLALQIRCRRSHRAANVALARYQHIS